MLSRKLIIKLMPPRQKNQLLMSVKSSMDLEHANCKCCLIMSCLHATMSILGYPSIVIRKTSSKMLAVLTDCKIELFYTSTKRRQTKLLNLQSEQICLINTNLSWVCTNFMKDNVYNLLFRVISRDHRNNWSMFQKYASDVFMWDERSECIANTTCILWKEPCILISHHHELNANVTLADLLM